MLKLKPLFGSLLRGGLCAVWLFGAAFAFMKFVMWSVSDYDSFNAHLYFQQTWVCLLVVAIAACTHAYLIYEETKRG